MSFGGPSPSIELPSPSGFSGPQGVFSPAPNLLDAQASSSSTTPLSISGAQTGQAGLQQQAHAQATLFQSVWYESARLRSLAVADVAPLVRDHLCVSSSCGESISCSPVADRPLRSPSSTASTCSPLAGGSSGSTSSALASGRLSPGRRQTDLDRRSSSRSYVPSLQLLPPFVPTDQSYGSPPRQCTTSCRLSPVSAIRSLEEVFLAVTRIKINEGIANFDRLVQLIQASVILGLYFSPSLSRPVYLSGSALTFPPLRQPRWDGRARRGSRPACVPRRWHLLARRRADVTLDGALCRSRPGWPSTAACTGPGRTSARRRTGLRRRARRCASRRSTSSTRSSGRGR